MYIIDSFHLHIVNVSHSKKGVPYDNDSHFIEAIKSVDTCVVSLEWNINNSSIENAPILKTKEPF